MSNEMIKTRRAGDKLDAIVRCKECGDKPCICEHKGMWAAHCMTCDNAIGHRGFYDPCALTEEEAEIRWNKLNTPNDLHHLKQHNHKGTE